MPEAVIVSAVRSPIGRAYKGSLKDLRPDDLSAQMITAALASVPGVSPADVEDVLWGCAQPGGEQAYNIARQAAIIAGLHDVPGVTVNRYCSSSLQTSRMAMHAIKAGEGDIFISGGVETVSRFFIGKADGAENSKNPAYADAMARTVETSANNTPWTDPVAAGLFSDIYIPMGETAENVATFKGVSKAAQDEYAVRSHNLAEAAIDRGFFERDITPVTLPDGTVVAGDDGPRRGTTLEKVSAMKPVFRETGTVSAANCCPLNDGAAALVIMSDVKAKQLGLTPLARIVSTGVTGINPEIMGLGPVEASKMALSRAGLSASDIDLVELNEAFAAQVLPSIDGIGVDIDKVNVNGGAIALGHPFGSTGARLTTTLIHGLQERDAQFGLETMCVGGGQGMAMVIERLS